MKVAITGPHFWPYRRRGSAAYLYNLSKHLADLGHDIEIITSKPGKFKTINEGQIKITYLPHLQHPVLNYYHINRVHMFALTCFTYLLRKKYDIIHCIYHPDGFSVNLLKNFKKLRYVYLVTTTPFRFHWKESPIDFYMFKKAIKGAEFCIVPSGYAKDCMKRDHNLNCEQIPCGVDFQRFMPLGPKDLRFPKILCTAALHDQRKNIPLLLKSFELLLKDGTKAVLQLAAETTSYTTRNLLAPVNQDVRKSIEILPTLTHTQLPEYYSAAAITVLPSINETFGMNMIESMACGTPVVGTRSGAIPEIINDPLIGTLFNFSHENSFIDNSMNLYDALKTTLDLAADPKTVERCRERASHYDWKKVVKQIESIYKRVISGES